MKILIFTKDAGRFQEIDTAILESIAENSLAALSMQCDYERGLFWGPPICGVEVICFLFSDSEVPVSEIAIIKKSISQKTSIPEERITEAQQF